MKAIARFFRWLFPKRHEHRFTIPTEGGLMRCDHPGCNMYDDPTFKDSRDRWMRKLDDIIAKRNV